MTDQDIDERDSGEDNHGFLPDFATWQEAVPFGVVCVMKRKRRLPAYSLVADHEVRSIVMSALWEGSKRGKLMTRAYVKTRAVGAFIDEVRKLSVGHRRGFLSRAQQRDIDDCLDFAELSIPPNQEAHEEQHERVELIELAIDGLDRRDRTIVEQVYLRERTFADVADDLHCSAARISQLHSRAIRRIRDRLTAQGHAVPPQPSKAARPNPTTEERDQRRQRVIALYRSDVPLNEIAELERTSLTTVKVVLRAAGVELVRRRPGRAAAPIPWHLRPRALELHQQERLHATAVARQLGIKPQIARQLLGSDYVATPYALRPRRRLAVKAAPTPIVAEAVKAEAVAEVPVAEVAIAKPIDLGAARVDVTLKRFDEALATVRRIVNAELTASRPRVPLACVASQGARITVSAPPPMANTPRLYIVPCTSDERTNTAPPEPPDARCERPRDLNLPRAIERLEDEFIGKALEASVGNKSQAAALLGLNRTTFVEMLKRKPRWQAALAEPHPRSATSAKPASSASSAPSVAAPAAAPSPPPSASRQKPASSGAPEAIPRLEILRLRAEGWHPRSIASRLGVNYWTVRKVLDTPAPVAKA